MGDAKFIAGLGFSFLNPAYIWIWLYLTYAMGLIHGLWRVFRQKSSRIPFGPSIYGAWLVMYMGELAHVAMDYSR